MPNYTDIPIRLDSSKNDSYISARSPIKVRWGGGRGRWEQRGGAWFEGGSCSSGGEGQGAKQSPQFGGKAPLILSIPLPKTYQPSHGAAIPSPTNSLPAPAEFLPPLQSAYPSPPPPAYSGQAPSSGEHVKLVPGEVCRIGGGLVGLGWEGRG